MKKYGYSRATFVIGFVLGPLLEHNFQLSLQLYGPTFLWTRPIALAMVLLLVASVVWAIVKPHVTGKPRRRRAVHDVADE